jgi:hypothetical protein
MRAIVHVCLAIGLAACARGAFEDGLGAENQEAETDSGTPAVDAGGRGRPGSSSSGGSSSGGMNTADLLDAGDAATTPSGTPRCVGLLINEVQTAGSSAAVEFVELYNPGPECSFVGWKLVYRSGTGTSDVVLFNATITLATTGYAVLGGTGYSGTKAGVLTGGLAADTGQLQLRDPGALVSDSMGYGSTTGTFVRGTPAPGPPASKSIGRSPNGVTTMNNGGDFKVLAAPSPGAANP